MAKNITGNQKPKPHQKGRRPYGEWVHRRVFAEASRVHGDHCATNQELLDHIRDDIVTLGIAKERSLSKLNSAQKTALVNHYIKMQGQKPTVKVPRRYDPARRKTREKNPEALPSWEQRAEMERLFDKLGYPEGEPRRKFCEHQCGRKIPPTRAAAVKVISGLRAMDDKGWRWGG